MLIKIRKIIHPLLLKILPAQRTFELKLLNKCPSVSGAKIFAMNHSNCHDAPIAGESIKEHYFILAGKQRLELMDKIFFFLNGTIFVDRKNKNSKRKSVHKMTHLLRKGENILMYPEGTWNLTSSKPMLPLYWGIVDLAKSADTPIIPVVAEYHQKCCYVKFGQPLYMGKKIDKQQGINLVSDVLATLKWEIWEMFPVEKRVNQLEKEFEEMIQKRIDEYPKLDVEYEKSVIRE